MNSSDEATTASNGGNNGGGFSSPVSLLSLVVLLGAVVAVLLVICFLYRRRQQRRLARQLRFTERRIDAVADTLKARKEQRALGGAATGRISVAPPSTRPGLPRLPSTPLGHTSMEGQYETAPSLSSVPESSGRSRGRMQKGMIVSSAEYIHHTYSAAPLRRTVTLPLPPPNTPTSSRAVCSVSHHSTWGSAHSSRTVSLTNEDQEDAIPLSSSSVHNSTEEGGESNMDELSSDCGQVERWV